MNAGLTISQDLLPYAYGPPEQTGVIRAAPEDFFVDEVLGFEPSGSGEHLFLFIEKTDLNTEQVARLLARCAGVGQQLVSYSGMKDRRAVTRQWFSVHVPGNRQVDWTGIESEQLRLIEQHRHAKKLRRGVHRGNRFVLQVTQLTGSIPLLEERAARIKRWGVPNYFGEQRFGHNGENLRQAERWFAGDFKPRRHLQGIYLSAARSYLFNQLLAKRVAANTWSSPLDGDLLMLAGSQSIFQFEEVQREQITERLRSGDVHLTGPLYGKSGKLSVMGFVSELEAAVMAAYPHLTAGLDKLAGAADRRALRVLPGDFNCLVDNTGTRLTLTFFLPRGCFATAVVRELLDYRVASDALG